MTAKAREEAEDQRRFQQQVRAQAEVLAREMGVEHPPAKKQKVKTEPAPAKTKMNPLRLVGDLLYPAKERILPAPTITDPTEQPCIPGLRLGKMCTLHEQGQCSKCHKPINELSPATQAEWKAHVSATPNLFFNKESVTCFTGDPALYVEPERKYYQQKRG